MPATFPANLKPIVNQGYSFGTPDNVLTVPTMGGSPLQVLDYKYGPVLIDVAIVGGRLEKMVVTDFYYGKINSGADKFYMTLDTGLGLEQHTVQIVAGSMQFNGGSDPTWIMTFQARAERTPAQDAPFDGNLADLYAVYGEDIDVILAALAVFALDDLPVLFV